MSAFDLNSNKRPVPLRSGSGDEIDRYVTYLTYSGIDAYKAYDGEGDSYSLLVFDEDKRKATEFLRPLIYEEKEGEKKKAEEDMENSFCAYSHVTSEEIALNKGHFVIAWFLLIIGFFLLLSANTPGFFSPATGQEEDASFFAYFITDLAAILMIVAAIRFFVLSQDIYRVMKDEAQLKEQLTAWFTATYDAPQIDQAVLAAKGTDLTDSEIEKARLDQISCCLIREDSHLSESLVSDLTHHLYLKLYRSNSMS